MLTLKYLSSFVYVVTVFLVVFHTKECSGRKKSANKCRKKIDLGIIIDASGSMGEDNFNTAKNFTRRLLSRFLITPSRTRVSLNYFSMYHHIVTKFNDDLETDELDSRIDDMKLENSFTNLAKTLTGLRYQVYPKVFGSRRGTKGSKMVAVFLTDAFDSLGAEETAYYAKQLREFGVTTYAVGVSGENSISGMLALAGKPAKKHQFHMYKNKRRLEEEIDKLVAEICK